MFRRIALAGTAIAALAAGTLSAGVANAVPIANPHTTPQLSWSHPNPGHSPRHSTSPAMAPQNYVSCYSQLQSGSGTAIVSQNLGGPPNDTLGADDFTIAGSSPCQLSRITAYGQYFNQQGAAASVQVTIWQNASGAPGSLWWTQTFSGSNLIDAQGTFIMTLASPLAIPAGTTYWISVQAQAVSMSDSWGWDTANPQTGYAAQWENPGDGYGTGCNTWANMMGCTGSTDPDFAFTLSYLQPPPSCYGQTAASYTQAARSRILTSTAINDLAADDFTMTHACKAKSLDIPGKYLLGAGPITGVLVRFYANQSGVVNHPNLSSAVTPAIASFTNTNGVLHITFVNTVGLNTGLHWISVQAIMNPGNNSWGWSTLPFQTGNPAVFVAATNINFSCLSWHKLTGPGCVIATQPDLAFTINP